VEPNESAEKHERTAAVHDEAADHHEQSVGFWSDQGDAERADLMRRAGELERQLAQLEREWADLVRKRAPRSDSD